jgi:hypothetical protein
VGTTIVPVVPVDVVDVFSVAVQIPVPVPVPVPIFVVDVPVPPTASAFFFALILTPSFHVTLTAAFRGTWTMGEDDAVPNPMKPNPGGWA